jgi:hypothetical protein
MKNILQLRRMFADLHYLRNMALVGVAARDKQLIRNKLKDMRRKIDAIEATLDESTT